MARRHATPADFELVGMSADPVPGDLDQIRGVVQHYGDIGDAAEKALNVLRKDGSISSGRGAAMDALREKVGDDLPGKLTKTARSYQDAAEAYRAYAPQLQQAQDTFDQAVEQAQAVAAQAAQTVAPLTADATEDDRAAAARQQDGIDNAKGQLSAAKGLAEQARSMRDAAARSCAKALDDAAGEAIPERGFFKKLGDFFKEFPFVQILVGVLIAVVTVFFPVVGLLLGAAFFAVTQIAAAASGNFKMGDFLVGLLALVPGGSLLKSLGSGLKAGSAVVAKAVPQLAKTVKGAGAAGITSSINSSKTVGPLVNSTGARSAGAAATGFGEGAALETGAQALNGEGFNAGQIAAAGAVGAVGGGLAGSRKPAGSQEPGGIPVKTGSGSGSGPGSGSRSLPAGSATPSTSTTSTPVPVPVPAGTVPSSLGLPTNATGGIDLGRQEALGGHAIERHVGKSRADLDSRLVVPKTATTPKVNGIKASSTFNDLAAAERSTSNNIAAHRTELSNFLANSAGPKRITITSPIPPTEGISRLAINHKDNNTGAVAEVPVKKVKTVIDRDPSAPGGFRIITSFPES